MSFGVGLELLAALVRGMLDANKPAVNPPEPIPIIEHAPVESVRGVPVEDF
jgi:hypothetical protein